MKQLNLRSKKQCGWQGSQIAFERYLADLKKQAPAKDPYAAARIRRDAINRSMNLDDDDSQTTYRIRVHSNSIFNGVRSAWLKKNDVVAIFAEKHLAELECARLNRAERANKSI
jgi:hypothetical protein